MVGWSSSVKALARHAPPVPVPCASAVQLNVRPATENGPSAGTLPSFGSRRSDVAVPVTEMLVIGAPCADSASSDVQNSPSGPYSFNSVPLHLPTTVPSFVVSSISADPASPIPLRVVNVGPAVPRAACVLCYGQVDAS